MPNGLGEYFGPQAQQQAAAGVPATPPSRTSVLATPESMPSTSGVGEYFAQDGTGLMGMGAFNLGAARNRRPGAFRRATSKVSPLANALGDATDLLSDARSGVTSGLSTATALTSSLIHLGLIFGAGWLVGKALAPSKAEEKTYAIGGGIASVLGGSLGLGATALVAQWKK